MQLKIGTTEENTREKFSKPSSRTSRSQINMSINISMTYFVRKEILGDDPCHPPPPQNFSQPSVGLLVPGSNRRETSEKLSEMRLQLLRGGRRRRDTSGVQKLFFSSSPLLLFLLQCRKASKNESFVGKTSLLLVWVRLLRTLFIASSSIYYMSCFSKKAEENVKEGSCDFLRNCKENSQPPFSLAAVQPDQAIPFQNSNSVHFCFRCMRNVKDLPDDKKDSRFCSNDYL